MLFVTVPRDILTAPISGDAKLLAGLILYLAQSTGVCNESYAQLGTEIGLSRRQVMFAMRQLTSQGIIEEFSGGAGRPKAWRPVQNLNWYKRGTGADSALGGTKSEPVQNQHRYRNSTGVVQNQHRTGTESAPPYRERRKEKNISASADADVPQFSLNGSAPQTKRHWTSSSRKEYLTPTQRVWFEEFWSDFWLKRDKVEAEKAFAVHARSEEIWIKIKAAKAAEMPEMLLRDPTHRPYAATWLNKRRYEDDFTETTVPVSIYSRAEEEDE